MYSVMLDNQSAVTLTASDGQSIPPGGQWKSGNLGSAWIRSEQIGPISFLDIADAHVSGDSSETWGVLISYQGEEVVGRYEGGGTLQVTLNKFLQASLHGMHFRQVSLPPFELS